MHARLKQAATDSVHMCKYMHACVWKIYIHMHLCVHIYIYTYTCKYIIYVQIYTYLNLYRNVYVHTTYTKQTIQILHANFFYRKLDLIFHVGVHICVYTNTCKYTLCICIYTFIYLHTYTLCPKNHNSKGQFFGTETRIRCSVYVHTYIRAQTLLNTYYIRAYTYK